MILGKEMLKEDVTESLDYFIRDKYFKISYPTNNLVRAKNQIKLLKDIVSFEYFE